MYKRQGEKYTEYEISQMQRKGERKVRALKRRAAALDEAAKNTDDPAVKQGLNDDFAAVSVRLKDAEKTLKDFCRQTGRRNDTFRSQVNGFGRSTAPVSYTHLDVYKRQTTRSHCR